VVPITDRIALNNAQGLRLSAVVQDPATGRNRTVTIPILSANVDPANTRNLVINTGQLVPRGATLQVANKALLNLQGRPLHNVRNVCIQNSSISPTDFILANRGFRPTNVNLFLNTAFSTASVAPNAVGNGLTEAQGKRELNNVLLQQFIRRQVSLSEYREALNLYDASTTKQIIPDPTLRASLLSLQGTVASGAIKAVLTGANQTGKPFAGIVYASDIGTIPAISIRLQNGSQIIKVNASMKAEPFQAQSALLAHEVMHQDNDSGQQEEIIAQAAKTLVWAQHLEINPKLATINSFLVRSANTDLLAMLNSGNRSFPRVGITSAPQIQTGSSIVPPKVFVGGFESVRNFDDYQRRPYILAGVADVNTQGNSYLDSFLSKATKSPITQATFSRDSLTQLDRAQSIISSQSAFRLAQIFKLTF
jgi:hypothetical protein